MSTRALTVLLALQACTLANDIDVCDREAPPEIDLNGALNNFETGAPGSIASLPSGGALVFFSSLELEGTTPSSYVRAMVLTAAGDRAFPCPRVASLMVPYLGASGLRAFAYPAAAGPEAAAAPSLGLLVAVRYLTNGEGEIVESELFGTAFDGDGCPLADPSGELVAIGDEVAGEQIVGVPSVARLADNRFVVAWVGGTSGGGTVRTRAKARIVETRRSLAPVLGPIIEIDRGWVTSVAMTSIGDGRIAFAWQRLVYPEAYRFLEIRSEELAPIDGLDRQLLEELEDATMRFDDPRMTLAYDGGQLLAAWTSRELGGSSRVLARFRGPSGEPFVAVDSLDGLAFEASDGSAGEEIFPVAAPLPGGGLVLAWEEHGASSQPSDRIRAVFFDRDGSRRFVNGSCGTAPISLDTLGDRPSFEPSLRALGGGLLASWTAKDSANGMSEVRARLFTARDLFPVE